MKLEFNDFSAFLTIVNVILVVTEFYFAPVVGLVNCCCNIIVAIKNRTHFNLLITQVALIILNCYFLLH